jgi:hypothetical protein
MGEVDEYERKRGGVEGKMSNAEETNGTRSMIQPMLFISLNRTFKYWG